MDANSAPPPRRDKAPKDGPGPRGFPECYYTSRVLNSTFRYVRFVNKLRQLEEEIRRGVETKHKEAKDKQTLDFFTRCDRKALINNVEQRVKLCMDAYLMDLEAKKKRLKELLQVEEEQHIRQFAEHAQAGAAAIWQEKKDRLAYLLAKRKKEHEERYKTVPLSKCPTLYRCMLRIQNEETQEMRLYQIREKQMRKMAELEMENMWHELAMKESEALAARMELDAIEQHRRDEECRRHTDQQLEEVRLRREAEREQLRREAMQLKAMVENNATVEAEEERKRAEKSAELGREKKENKREREEALAKRDADEKRIDQTWDSLADQSRQSDLAAEERDKQKRRDLDECNRKLIDMKERIATIKDNNEPMILQEGQRIRDAADLKRCQRRKWSQQIQKDNAATALKHMNDKHKLSAEEREQDAATQEYEAQVRRQLDELVKHKEMTDARARKLYQNDLKEQIAYNNLLKERAREEKLQQMKKCDIATREFEQQLCHMLNRPFFSDELHPFMKKMASGLTMARKCPCSQPDYCADPPPTQQTQETQPPANKN